MGLKERVQSVEGKTLMTSLFAAEMLDIAMTKVAVQHLGATELNPLQAELINSDKPFILKIASTAIILGAYALASDNNQELRRRIKSVDIKYGFERGIQWGSLMMWGIVAWNTANLLHEVVKNIT